MKALASIGRRREFFLHLSWLASFAEFEVAISRNNDLQQQHRQQERASPGGNCRIPAAAPSKKGRDM
ncbi:MULTISPECIES: hypothetical protein [Cupriavidus]|uniref:hypothetical protein n=1 Tax=Cupriavidus TaxID=106589 RepID=UPI0012691F83|nr:MULTISPECIES: hypothetical protein [Cupriavidus]MDF3886334.1 hypothetical protein [Cupriavidus basilensis]